MSSSKITDKEAVRQLFTTTAADYSRLFLSGRAGSNFSFRERLALATQMTSNISGRLFDCACGSGEITAAILDSGCFSSATLIDLSPQMLEMAQQRMAVASRSPEFRKLEFTESDIFEFDVQSRAGQYDLVLCLGLIAHTGRLDCLLPKLKMLLSAGGCILLQTSLLDHVGNRIVRLLTQNRYYRRHGYRISYFRHRDIVQAVQGTGLDIVSMRRFTFGFPFGDRFCGRINHSLEKMMIKWSHSHGAEALYLLQRPPGK
jgi:2-polyprenyl-3-methyl-5-hydroxy-6-metoxy-1,4-benzoquinol methylase